jgi:hypothetical protein
MGVDVAARGLLGTAGPTDLIQDWLGARALLDGAPAAGANLLQVSTHPPTSFLFLVPLAHVPFALATQVWTVAMLGCLVGSAWALGGRGPRGLLIVPLLFWPPVLWSLVGGVPIWLLGVSLAWRWRDRPLVSGALIGLAALPRGAAVLLLGPFVRRRQWPAMLGLVLVGGAALAAVGGLSLSDYWTVQVRDGEAARQIARSDNGGLLAFAFVQLGWPGLLTAVALMGAVAWRALRGHDQDEWSAWAWLSVALLPVAWTYSLLPLLPGLLWSTASGRIPALFAAAALLAPFAGPTPATNPTAVWTTIVLAGLAVVWPAHRSRANTSARTSRAPASDSASAHAESVAPVVATSSTSTTR